MRLPCPVIPDLGMHSCSHPLPFLLPIKFVLFSHSFYRHWLWLFIAKIIYLLLLAFYCHSFMASPLWVLCPQTQGTSSHSFSQTITRISCYFIQNTNTDICLFVILHWHIQNKPKSLQGPLSVSIILSFYLSLSYPLYAHMNYKLSGTECFILFAYWQQQSPAWQINK